MKAPLHLILPNLCSTLIVLEVLSNLSNIYGMRVAVAMSEVGFEVSITEQGVLVELQKNI